MIGQLIMSVTTASAIAMTVRPASTPDKGSRSRSNAEGPPSRDGREDDVVAGAVLRVPGLCDLLELGVPLPQLDAVCSQVGEWEGQRPCCAQEEADHRDGVDESMV